jgi:hypothetical protein
MTYHDPNITARMMSDMLEGERNAAIAESDETVVDARLLFARRRNQAAVAEACRSGAASPEPDRTV